MLRPRESLVSTMLPPSGNCDCPLLHVCAEQHLRRMTDVQPADRLLDGPMTALTMPRRSADLSRQGRLWAVRHLPPYRAVPRGIEKGAMANGPLGSWSWCSV